MLRLNRTTLNHPELTLIADGDIRVRCPRCGAREAWHHDHCRACGATEPASRLCTRCDEELTGDQVEYTAVGKEQVRIIKLFPAHRCPRCNRVYLAASLPSDLDAFVDSVPEGFRLLPGVGISCKTFLEIFATGGKFSNGTPEVSRQHNDIQMRFGPRSQLFQRALPYLSDLDEKENRYRQSLYTTLRVTPAPPYSSEQRKTLHLLLSHIRLDIRTTLSFWPVHVGNISATEREKAVEQLLTLVQQWPRDTDRRALALANTICNDEHPGVFVNTFRLLELVLERLIDDDIQRVRWDQGVSNQYLLMLAKTYELDLATRLKRRIGSLANVPRDLLRDLWRVIHPDKGYNPEEIFAEIIKFRDTTYHGTLPFRGELRLPWEEPAFDFFVNRLLRLVIAILSEYVEERVL